MAILFLIFLVFIGFVFFIYPKYIKPELIGHLKCEKIRYLDGTYAIVKDTCKPYPWYQILKDIWSIFEKNPTILS